jgi:hypothetical protein
MDNEGRPVKPADWRDYVRVFSCMLYPLSGFLAYFVIINGNGTSGMVWQIVFVLFFGVFTLVTNIVILAVARGKRGIPAFCLIFGLLIWASWLWMLFL